MPVLASDPDWIARGLSAFSGIVALTSLTLAWRVYQRGGARVQITLVEHRRRRIFRIH